MNHRTQAEERKLFMQNGFSAITKENLEDCYNRRYNRFKFDNSDEVKIDGILQSNEEKTLIKLSFYNIVPTPKEIIVSDLLNGFEITEKRFIEKELIILDNFKHDLLDLKNRIQFAFYKEYLNKKNLPKEIKIKKLNTYKTFSVLEWATIFYYADQTKLLPKEKFKSTRIKDFIVKHKIETSFSYFKNEYHIAEKRINDNNDFPINKLEKIIPFLKSNYTKAVTKVNNDIIFLGNELLD